MLNDADKYNLITRMAEDSLRMCRGIEDLNGVKFAQFVEDELRHLHVEKRGRWGA